MLYEVPVVEQAAVVYGIALQPCAYRSPEACMSRLKQANHFSGEHQLTYYRYPHANTM
jgi:hypothetical protein